MQVLADDGGGDIAVALPTVKAPAATAVIPKGITVMLPPAPVPLPSPAPMPPTIRLPIAGPVAPVPPAVPVQQPVPTPAPTPTPAVRVAKTYTQYWTGGPFPPGVDYSPADWPALFAQWQNESQDRTAGVIRTAKFGALYVTLGTGAIPESFQGQDPNDTGGPASTMMFLLEPGGISTYYGTTNNIGDALTNLFPVVWGLALGGALAFGGGGAAAGAGDSVTSAFGDTATSLTNAGGQALESATDTAISSAESFGGAGGDLAGGLGDAGSLGSNGLSGVGTDLGSSSGLPGVADSSGLDTSAADNFATDVGNTQSISVDPYANETNKFLGQQNAADSGTDLLRTDLNTVDLSSSITDSLPNSSGLPKLPSGVVNKLLGLVLSGVIKPKPKPVSKPIAGTVHPIHSPTVSTGIGNSLHLPGLVSGGPGAGGSRLVGGGNQRAQAHAAGSAGVAGNPWPWVAGAAVLLLIMKG